MTQFVYANHAGDMMNRRSHMGIHIYICRATIIWYIKKQNTVKSSTLVFGNCGYTERNGAHKEPTIQDQDDGHPN